MNKENYYNLNPETVLRRLKTTKDGLSIKEAKKRLDKYGLNKLEDEKPLGRLVILLAQFKSPLIYILLIAGFISFLLHEYVDTGVILGAVLLNTIIGYFQENKANQALCKLKKMVEHKTIVIRDGHELRVDSSLITIGDIVVLQAGNRVPADGRIIKADNLQANESSLTGESFPSKKSVNKLSKGASLADRVNMVFAGTVTVTGSGLAVITATGSNTEIGEIAKLVKTTKEEKTPLQNRLGRLSTFIGIGVAFISLGIIGVGILQGRDFFEMFIVGVAIAVAAIPEGLIVAVTVILVLGMQRILQKKALVRKLVAAETLGSTTVICTDKTGTLTEGKMHVVHIIIGENEYEVKNEGTRQGQKEAKLVSLGLQIGLMCNDAVIENPEEELNEWRIIGTPTEEALLSAAVQSGLDREKILKNEPKIATLPFSSETKYMVTLHKKDNGYVLYEKGAPEKLLAKSGHFFHQGKIIKLDKKEREKLNKAYEELTTRGLRVIGVAKREIGSLSSNKIDWELIGKDLVFVGFIALKDPLRKEARETIIICKQAGIRPIIITGDHKLTARAIAHEVGIKVKAENIITGEEMDKIDDKELKVQVSKINIFARVSPKHKLRIVKALQANGEVVAMTGDGINDSPALKAADIGVSLGGGTDIAKETSDIVLLDNNFKTIVAAVREGRIIFSNIRKVVTYLISDSFSEVIVITGSILLGMPLALVPAQILWINIVNDGLPDFSLAFEKGEKGIMKAKPIRRDEPIINKEMKIIIFFVGIVRDLLILGLFVLILRFSGDIEYSRTILFAIFGVKSLMSIFSIRSLKYPIWRINPFSNIRLVGAVAISLALLLGAIYWPPLQAALSTIAITDLNSWLLIVFVGISSVVMIEIAKYFSIEKEAEK